MVGLPSHPSGPSEQGATLLWEMQKTDLAFLLGQSPLHLSSRRVPQEAEENPAFVMAIPP